MPKINYAAMFTLRSDGRYMGYWREPDKNGKPTGPRHAIYAKDPEELYHKIQAKEAPQAPTFSQAADQWEAEHVAKLSNHTQHDYAHRIKYLKEAHEGETLEDVDAAAVNRTLLKLASQGFGLKSVKAYRSMYKQIFDYAIIKGWIRTNPTSAVNTPRGLARSTREAPSDEIIRIIKANAATAHFGLFPLFLIYTGFRRGEALAVQWQDIDFQNKTIRCTKTVEQIGSGVSIKAPKTEAGVREVPLLDELAALLQPPPDAKPTDYVFGGKKPMNGGRYTQEWLLWCRDVGLIERRPEKRGKDAQGKPRLTMGEYPTITAHQLRHGYATILYEAGIDELTAKELLGHADIATTHAIYTHIRQGKREEAAQTLNAKFKSI